MSAGRRLLLLLLVSLVVLPAPAPAQTFTRGQWTQWKAPAGTLTYRQAQWRQTAGTNATMLANGSEGTSTGANGGRITTGLTVGEFRHGSAPITQPFVGNARPGVWDSTRRRLMFFPVGGHGAWANFEIEEFDLATGTWNPNGRPQDPYSALVRMGSVSMAYTHAEALYVDPNSNDPIMLFDPNHLYDSLALVDPAFGVRAFPNAAHSLTDGIYMPSVDRFLRLPGYAVDWGGNRNAALFEWNPVTKQWQSNWADYPGTKYADYTWENQCGVWDPVHNVVIFMSNRHLYKYDPTQPLGSRATRIISNLAHGTNTSLQPEMLWDSKRSRIVVLSTTNQSGNFMITNLPNTPVESSVPPITGPLANSFGPKFGAGYAKVFGWAYDPVGDRYLYWGGGQTIYWVDPETWVSTAETPGGANPGTRTWIEAPVINGGYHIIYDSVLDVFMAVQTSADYEGIALYAPNRGAPQSCTSPISPRGRRPGIRIPRRARRRGRMG